MKNKQHRKTQVFSIIASLLMVFSLLTPGLVSANSSDTYVRFNETSKTEKMSSRLASEFAEDEKVSFLIKFKEKADTTKVVQRVKTNAAKRMLSSYDERFLQRSAVVSELKATAQYEQGHVLKYLEQEKANGNVDNIKSFFIVNGISVTATKEVAEKLASFSEVEKILPNETRQLIKSTTTEITPAVTAENVEWNVEKVGAPSVWDMGIDGTGVVVATIDSGVQWDHPAIKEKYRGYDVETGEVNHSFNWFDAVTGQKTPYDDVAHGTHVTGTIVGGESDGNNKIGVAPGAKWIAVKAFSEDGGDDADLLEAAEWILAPTDENGKTRVDLAPDIVNNSWSGGPGLDEWYRDVVIEWKNANIFPLFAAGNTTIHNPGGPESISSPANYPESFAVGATNNNNTVANFSLLGPSPYGEIKPDISAPGVNIRSSVPGGKYEDRWNGTSMAAPAVAGVIALLYEVNSSLIIDEVVEILIETAKPLTDKNYPETPNNAYGYGLIDAYQAVSSIEAAPVIHSPKQHEVFDEENIVVEGEASPTTTIQLMNNDVVVGTANVGDEGKFSIPITLTAGDNKLIANSTMDGKLTNKSKPVTAVYITEEPKIEKVSPSENQYVLPGEVVKVKVKSNVLHGDARFEVKFPTQESALSSANKMNEVEPGIYEGSWTVPKSVSIQNVSIGVTVTDLLGNKTSEEADGKLMIHQKNMERISGKDRYLTAIDISRQGWTKSDKVILARGDGFADALAGVPLAHKMSAPILLTVSKKLGMETLDEIKRLGSKEIVVLGGATAISENVVIELEKEGLKVQRIAGNDRFETAAKIALFVSPNGTDEAVIVNGMDFPDALSVASHAATNGLPILLTQATKLPAATKDKLKELNATKTIVVGGKTVVSDDVANQLPYMIRLAGKDRYETNSQVANHFGGQGQNVYVATGKGYADALTGAVFAAKNNSTVLLVHDRVPEVVTTYITENSTKRLTIFGGETAVSKKVASELEKLLQ